MTLTVSFDRPSGTEPGRIRRFFGTARTSLALAVGILMATAVMPHKASLLRLLDMPLTVLGIAGIDFASFHIGHGWGWLFTGISLLVLEHLIADPDSK